MAGEPRSDGLQALKRVIRGGNPENLYIFHGEEVFLLHHYLEQLKKAVLDEMTESFNFHRFTGENFEPLAFAEAVENLPMMAQRTLVQVDEVDLFRMPEESRSRLADVLCDIPEYCTVVFTYETTAWKPDKRQKRLWEAVSAGQIVEFAKQSQRDLISWVSRHFAACGKQIAPELCAYLIEITDGTMTSLSGEIRKIAAYSGADTIRKSDIDAVTEPVLDAVVFRMTDQLAAGAYDAALQTLEKLLKMQQEPIAILGAVGGHFRRLSAARTLLDNGKGVQELRELYSLTEYPARKAMDAARRFQPAFCAKAAALILETDYRMKTSFDDPQRLLEILLLRLAQEAKND